MDKALRMIQTAVTQLTPDTKKYLHKGIAKIIEEEGYIYKGLVDNDQ